MGKNEQKYSPEKSIDAMIELFNSMLEQVRLQQEVRDRWFEHYLSIVGALSAIATLCFGYYSDKISESGLMFLMALFFGVAFVLGFFFYLLYLLQRRNYKKKYKELNILQNIIYNSNFPH